MKEESAKADIFMKKFRQVETQSLKPNDMLLSSDNVEMLLRAVIEDLHNLSEKRDWCTEESLHCPKEGFL